MLYAEKIVNAVVSVLLAANTDAGSSIYSERDWPLTEPQLPSIMVKSPVERKESLVRGVPTFETHASIAILIRAAGANSQQVAWKLATIKEQVELAILSSGSDVQQMVEEFESVDSDTRTTSEGNKPMGDTLMVIVCRFFEQFPPTGSPLNQIDLDMTFGTQTITGAINIADPGSAVTIEPLWSQ